MYKARLVKAKNRKKRRDHDGRPPPPQRPAGGWTHGLARVAAGPVAMLRERFKLLATRVRFLPGGPQARVPPSRYDPWTSVLNNYRD